MLSMIVLTVAGVLALFLGFSKTKSLILPVAMLGILASAAAYYFYQPLWSEWLLGMMGTFGPPSVFTGLLLACTFLILPFLNVYKLRGSGELGDFTGIILFSVIGGMMMVAHQDLMILFLGIEILSIAMYILARSGPLLRFHRILQYIRRKDHLSGIVFHQHPDPVCVSCL